MWTPYRWIFARDYAAAVSEAYFYRPETMPQEEVLQALLAMQEAVREHPEDAYNHYAFLDMLNQTSDLNPEEWLARAEEEAAIALRLSPNRQQVLFSLAKTKFLKGEKQEGLRLIEYALELNPNVPDAYFYYGVLLFDLGELERGYEALQKALVLGRRWKNYHEPRVAANYFADSGHLAEAIELYKTAIAMAGGDDLEAQVKLGVAYFLLGQREEARAEIGRVIEKVNLRESPSYEDLEPILQELGLL
jgi:tetratricopeptide (TPR) repeat protein